MSGRRGQIQRVVREGTVRDKAWVTVRKYLAGGFTIHDLLRTLPEAKESNLDKWIRALVRHGYLAPVSRGKLGSRERTSYRLVREGDTAALPLVCNRCGNPVMGKSECFNQPDPSSGAA